MANEKELVKQQLQQQEELANSPALAQRPPAAGATITMTPTTSGSGKSAFAFSAPSYPFSGLSSASKGKLVLPTALWVLLIMAGVCFLFLLGSLTKSMRTLDTLVELEIEQAQRDAIHLDNLEQTLSEATRASAMNRNSQLHQHQDSGILSGNKASGNEDSAWFGPLGWVSESPGRSHLARQQQRDQQPQVISSSSVEYLLPIGNSGRLEDSPSNVIKSLIDSFLQDAIPGSREAAAKQAAESEDSDSTKITANIDKIDVHINTLPNGDDQVERPRGYGKNVNKKQDQNKQFEQTFSVIGETSADEDQGDDLSSLLSLLLQPTSATTNSKSQQHHKLINTQTSRPLFKIASNDQDDILNSVLEMIERDAVENFKKDNKQHIQSSSSHLFFSDEKPKVPSLKPTQTISSQPIHVITNFGSPSTNPHSSDLGGFGSPILPASKLNGLPAKSKIDEQLENLANDLIVTLGKFSPHADSTSSKSAPKSPKTPDDNFGNNIILFSSNEPSIGKHQKSQSLSLDERPSGQHHKQAHLTPDTDNEVTKFFQMFFGQQPSQDIFKFSSGTGTGTKHSPSGPTSQVSDFKPLTTMDDFIPTIEIKSSSSSSSSNADQQLPLVINSFEGEQKQAPTTTLAPSSNLKQHSPAESLSSKAALPTTTTVEPSLDVFVDAVLDELMPTAAQSSGDKTGAKVENKINKHSERPILKL